MTQRFARKFRSVRIVALSVATITILLTCTALTQQAKTGLSFARPATAQRVRPGRAQVGTSAATEPNSQGFSFLPVMTESLGCIPYGLAVGDFNGDGHPDVVVSNWYQNCSGVFGPGAVEVLLGNGDGTFRTAVSYGSGGNQALFVAAGDLNGDGKPDLVVANSCKDNGSGGCVANSSGLVGVLLGNEDGTFQSAVGYLSGGDLPNGVAIADVNGDGHPDLVVSNGCTPLPGEGCTNPGIVGILLGKGDGTFLSAVGYPAGNENIVSLAVADLNGDGHLDVVAIGGEDGVLSVLLGNGDGTFQSQVEYESVGYELNSVAIADLNGDGHPDLIVASYCQILEPPCDTGNLAVMLGKGDGTFQTAVNYSSGGFDARSVAVADLNGDGHPDLIVTDSNSNGSEGPGEVGLLQGNGDGTFQAAVAYPSGGIAPISVAVADVNGDGKPDVLAVNIVEDGGCNCTSPGSVGVLLNNAGLTQAATTTALTSSPNPSIAGQQVIFTAAVSSASGTPTGLVIFYNTGTTLGKATLANGTAVLSLSSLTAGPYSILAVYQGTSSFAPSTSAWLNQVVNKATTTIALTSSKNPESLGGPVTYTATVSGQNGVATTGTVTFTDGGAAFAIVSVSGQTATYRTHYSTIGSHSIAAIYSGDQNNLGSTSPTLTQSIEAASTTTLTTSASTSFVGQPVTFTATVTSSYGAIPNGELVTFKAGTTVLGTGTTSSGVTALTTTSLAKGSHSIKATYSGDTTFLESSGSVHQVVDRYSTTTTLVSSPNPSTFGQAITFTATVSSSGPLPTGKVTFKDGSTGIGSATVSGGVAVLTKSTLAVGSHSVTATYGGDTESDKSTSAGLTQTVN